MREILLMRYELWVMGYGSWIVYMCVCIYIYMCHDETRTEERPGLR